MHVPAIKFGRRITANFNKLIGRYPGADGMKTGFICASGFNLVATATRNNKRLIAVVLGAQSSAQRALKAAQLLERGFNGNKLSSLKPSLGTVDSFRTDRCVAAEPARRNVRPGNASGPPRKMRKTIRTSWRTATAPILEYRCSRPAFRPDHESLRPDGDARRRGDAGDRLYRPARTGAAILEADAAEAANQAASVAKRKKGAKGAKAAKLAAKPEAETTKPKDAKPAAKPAAAAPKPKAAAAAPAAKPAPKTDKKPDAAAKPAAAKPGLPPSQPQAARQRTSRLPASQACRAAEARRIAPRLVHRAVMVLCKSPASAAPVT